MNYRFKHIAAGYVGELYEFGTLNSRYYALLLSAIKDDPSIFDELVVFPQRIPRSGLFEEINKLENKDYQQAFHKTIEKLQHAYANAAKHLLTDNNHTNAARFINYANFLLRYGQFNFLIKNFPKNYQGPLNLEIELIKETAKIEMLLSQDSPISLDEQLELVDRFLDESNVTVREQIKLLNQIIVCFYRHIRKKAPDKITQLNNKLLSLTEVFENHCFSNMLYCSISYRGLAMVSEFDSNQKQYYLDKAAQLARNLQPNNPLESLVAADNLYTCHQSLAKWHLINKNLDECEKQLLELLNIDPYDSTGYSEIGFFYLQSNSHDKASDYFKKAMELGPPGAGMNAYYYAKCLEQQGSPDKAVEAFFESTQLDNYGISAWLDLLSYFTNTKQSIKAQEIANHLYKTSHLYEQLEHDEIELIQSIIT